MLHWICPECGRECEPVERDCPDCYPEAAATLVTAGAANASASAVVSIPQVLAARTGVVLPPPLPPPLPVPSFLLPEPEPEPEPEPAPAPIAAEAPDPVPAGLTALSVSMEAHALGKQPPSIAAVLEPMFHAAGQDLPVAGLPCESGVEPQPVGRMREPATLELPVFRQYRAFRPSAPPSFTNGANALAFDAIAYQEEEAHLVEPAGLAQSVSGLELASDPAVLRVLDEEAAASRTQQLWDAFHIHAPRVAAPVSFASPARPAPAAIASDADSLAYAPEPEVSPRPNVTLRQMAGIAEDIDLLAKVATYEAHQRTVRVLDEAASQMGPLLYRRFRPIPRTIAIALCAPVLRFWPWATVEPTAPVHLLPENFAIEPDILEAVQNWEVEQQVLEAARAEAEAEAAQAASEASMLMGPEVPTMYHLAIPVIPPPPQQQQQAAPTPEPEPEPEPQPQPARQDAEDRFSQTMRFAVPVPAPPLSKPEPQPELEPEPEPAPVVLEADATPDPAPALEPEVVTSTEVIHLSNAIVVANREQSRASDTGQYVLTPIIEAPVPPMAKQVKLPWYGLSPVSVKPAPRELNIPPVFVIADAYIPPRSTKASRPIPSPLLHSRNAAVSRPPSWLVTAAVAVLIPITAIGVVNYWILPAQRASAATEAVEPTSSSPTAAQQESPAAASWRKQLQLTGIRMQDSKVRFVLINHAKTDAPAMSLLVHLRAVNAKAADPAIASFQIRLSPLAPGEARDLSSAIDLIPPVRNVDWSDIRAEIQTAKML